ncbi:MAG: molybdenum ABC transporter ATP-binding protein [Paludisphaera borealis]|nr:molybdenum ABC transporter ATP-binding protein [Paludisphaera borealis]
MKGQRPVLEVQVSRRVHHGLAVDATISLDGEIGVVFGPSGSGKSTLLRLIAGLTRPDAGRIALGGDVLFDSSRGVDVRLRHRRIGMIFQDDLLFPHLRVGANIGFGLNHEARDRRASRLAEVAALCGVEHLLDRWPSTLSGGERQRVGLARALAPKPRLLLCDEPVSALDLPNRHALLEGLRRVQKAEGLPVLYVTHSPAEAIALGTRLFLIEHGRLVAEGSPLDVLANSRHAGFLHLEGVRNVFLGRVAEHADDQGSTRLELTGGPSLIVPHVDHPLGTAMIAEIRGDDVLLSLEPVTGVSARNLIEGVVEAVVPHGHEAEIVVRTGDLRWLASTVGPASGPLALSAGQTVYMIIKARSCRVALATPARV